MSSNITQRKKHKKSIRNKKTLLPALVAVGSACSLAAMPAAALELGDVQVNSTLGQPLRASIAYALNPNEQLANYCIYLRPGAGGNGMPVVSQAQISVTSNTIILTGNAPIREPMLGMQLVVDCPYTPHLLRSYTLMVDPAMPIRAAVAQTETTARSVPLEAPVRAVAPPVANNQPSTPQPRSVPKTPIVQGSQYTVQRGDTVSTIVARIENRSIGLWPAVDAIFAANPDAFINNDVNRLMSGKILVIPELIGGAPTAVADVVEVMPQVTVAPVTTATIAEPEAAAEIDLNAAPLQTVAEPVETAIAETTIVETPAASVAVDVADASLETTVPVDDQSSDLQPGDLVASPTATEITLPDTIVEDTTATRVVPVVGAPATDGNQGAWRWLMWLGGTGIALILGLLLFGRNIRDRFGAPTVGAASVSGRRSDDDPTQSTPIVTDVDYEFEDTINSQAISLDADLGEGTGLHSALDINVAEDYGYASADTPSVDMEITAEAAYEVEEVPTDLIPPQHREDASSILDSEVPPQIDDDEEYDLSMIVDATKQPIGDYDDTAKDLQAIQIDTDIEATDDNDYTVSKDVDYQVLEQDYENELTATQALNEDVRKAAEELALRMQEGDNIQVTAEMQEITETTNEMATAEKTREMPAADNTTETEMSSVVNPDHTAELTTSLPTTLEADNDASAEQSTIEMSAVGSDVTVEMPAKSDTIKTKKK